MKYNYIILLILASIIGVGTANAQKEIVILHVNDFHSQIEPMRIGRTAGLGGAHRIAEYIEQVRKENKNVLLLDAGDYSQGTPYFTIFKGDLETQILNTVKVDVACLGNHEFDNGIDEIARRLKKSKFKTVCANYDFSGTPLKRQVEPYVIERIGGVKIGIIGLLADLSDLVMRETSSAIKFLDPIEITNKWAKYLKEEKDCDIVIALSHLGYSAPSDEDSDITLAKGTRNVDLIIGGHTHTFLKEEKIFENLDGKDVVVVQVGAKGEYVGRFDLTVNP